MDQRLQALLAQRKELQRELRESSSKQYSDGVRKELESVERKIDNLMKGNK